VQDCDSETFGRLTARLMLEPMRTGAEDILPGQRTTAQCELCLTAPDIQGGPKNWHTVLYALTSSNIDPIFKLILLTESKEHL